MANSFLVAVRRRRLRGIRLLPTTEVPPECYVDYRYQDRETGDQRESGDRISRGAEENQDGKKGD